MQFKIFLGTGSVVLERQLQQYFFFQNFKTLACKRQNIRINFQFEILFYYHSNTQLENLKNW